MAYLGGKTILPTELRTWALQLLPVEIRERAFFSAGVTQAEFLQEALDSVKAIVSGGSDRATQRLGLKQLLDRLGYQPETGTEGGLQDLSSDKRLNLILDTNAAQARGYGTHVAKQSPTILRLRPAQELYRVGPMPRMPRDWAAKWDAARAATQAEGATPASSGRLVARKDHPIWSLSIDEGGFNRFGTPYPPYDFNSGMRVRDVTREDALALGVIQGDEAPKPDRSRLNTELQASPQVGSEQLRRALVESGFGTFTADGKFVPSANALAWAGKGGVA